MFKAQINVTLKKTVSDPQGLAVKHALESLGYREVKDARIGKSISLKLNADDRKVVRKILDEMCKKLLANPIIEEYSFKIREVK